MASGLIAGGVWGQPPARLTKPDAACERTGFFHRMFHHSAHTLHDKLIGYPETFIEPPLGYYVREQFTLQVAKADPHRFTLYRATSSPAPIASLPRGRRGST